MRLAGSDGRAYQTQAELARGGEGAILSLQGQADLLAKLYLPGQDTPAREAKLRAMLADPPQDEMRERLHHAAIAWPVALLHQGGRFAGFLMPRIDAAHPLVNAYNPRARDALGFDWHNQHQVAANLCAALNALHAKGYVVGDLNPRNILVTAQGLVTLVDTDSFQVRANGAVHRCPVGTPEYTPRELQGQHFERIDRAPEHDRFGLAVLVFQLLMGGFHPFSGALKDLRDSLPGKIDEWCIQNGVFPWRDHPRLRRPPAARPLEDLDPPLCELFLRGFVSGHAAPGLRPSALEWRDALLVGQQRLVRCATGAHWRYPGSAPCHACQRQAPPARAAQPRPRPQPAPQPSPQAVPAPAPWWKRRQVAAVFAALAALAALAAVLVLVLYNRWASRPEALAASYLDQARAALAGGDPATADQAMKKAATHAPELAAALARDQAALYRELARRAQAGGDTEKGALALAEAQRWETAAGTAPGPASAKAPDPPAQAAGDKRQGPVGTLEQAMVTIPGGEFQMGCSPGDSDCASDEKPPHRVRITPFRMGKYEVTQAQWQAVMGENPSRFKGEDRPVEQVSWDDIQAFLKRLNAGNPGKPYRLPSEAEWEYAARAGTTTPYWWGKDLGKGNANCDGCGSRWDNKETAPVGSFKPNPFGLYDTAGNVWEWVQDRWHNTYTGAPTDGSAWESGNDARRGLRGGSWTNYALGLRVSYRYWFVPTFRYYGGGVRLAQDL
jgi:formylglycine-generating enzyme required for sulfatase activity